ncbi:3-hydroxy-D-aspartate aldolase [Stella humosa]|uniref:3-hydroxy-D-aspartate aldolase n=1 Tax=Stella humosa TaxID=94 RepID=A0A3N1MDZ5_9PROT|nr:DSD1 family PLP-dependent enzyme [Stella humosa]ROQ01961.1 3-hydroxy-D-aspartate aldolase [Stella humosa]BBK32350.1 alanine racemase [Stella humosa]
MPQRPPADIGMPVSEIDTPALVIDLDALERNIAKLAEVSRRTGVRLRPHTKTHKSPIIALKQIEAGAIGQCCQKVGEAEVLVAGGVRDVLVSNQVVGDRKLARLAALAQSARVALCVDAPEHIEAAGRAAREYGVELGALVEIDVGTARCGVEPGEAAVKLAQQIAATPGLRFGGLQAYHGTAQHLATWDERKAAIELAVAKTKLTVDALAAVGLSCDIVGGAGTGTFQFESTSGVYNELQCGSYLFMDTDYARIGGKTSNRYDEFEHSLFVLATVMSVPTADRAICDAGLKAYTMEKGAPWVHGRDDLEVTGVSDEHGKVRTTGAKTPLKLGDKLWLIPGHCDPTINLHDWYVGVRKGRVEAVWPIAARGASQ